MSQVLVREFQPQDREAFHRLNEAWISKYFRIEPKDLETITDAQRQIIDQGGQVFMAILDGEAVGCVGLMKMGERTYELVKMATDERFQRRGIGRALMEAAIAWARKQKARCLYLETNHVLTPAITLYETSGFHHVPAERRRQSPYARADVQMEMWLDPEWVKYL
jgi:putative acetyltransferase